VICIAQTSFAVTVNTLGRVSATGNFDIRAENAMIILERNREISDRLAQGYRSEEIALDLRIAKRTVKAGLRRLFMDNGLTRFRGIKHLKLVAILLDAGECEPVMIGADMRHLLRMNERKIAGYVARGLTNAQIGLALDRSEQSVKNMLREIYDKTGMDNRLELLLWWRAHGQPFKSQPWYNVPQACAVGGRFPACE
jgi:DNA-binding CsgD family transcriptional regulator